MSIFLRVWAAALIAVGWPLHAQKAAAVPVVVELFTSEGCSSCPPADALLIQLENAQPVAGAHIIVLSQHVDYWNRLGWIDPFSSGQFSRRQSEYAASLGQNGVYTPQMVVDGAVGFVGNDAANARAAIRQAATLPKAEVVLTVGALRASKIPIAVQVSRLDAVASSGNLDLVLAVTETGLASQVSAGENSGRRILHTGVVRILKALGKVDAAKHERYASQTEIDLPAAWNRGNLKAVAFLQSRASRRIVGAAEMTLSMP
jgi:hypothetical protein